MELTQKPAQDWNNEKTISKRGDQADQSKILPI